MGHVVVTGGAGYVGSHVVKELQAAGEDVVIVDDLSQGHRAAARGTRLVEADFADPRALDEMLDGAEAVVHMAAFCEVGASVEDPASYYRNNVGRTLGLLDAVRKWKVPSFVFSSSAATYGEPQSVPIDEEHPALPTNPYGETKLVIERCLSWYADAYGLRTLALRYFNAAGAHPDGALGEDHPPESHLVPRLLQSLGDDGAPTPIFGTDWPTRDGTCVRDYVHVVDLALAHRLAVKALREGAGLPRALNLGNGDGFTVNEVCAAVERVAGRRPLTAPAPRRPGDPATLVASSARARELLGWQPRHASLDDIVGTAWSWHRENPQGYGDG
jgi:UDP-glucose 4-epimerase